MPQATAKKPLAPQRQTPEPTGKTPAVMSEEEFDKANPAAQAATVGGERIEEFIDVTSLEAQNRKFAEQNRRQGRGFRSYQKKVIDRAGVRNTHQHRQLASDVCGSVARLSALPDREITVSDAQGNDVTEWDLQVQAIANFACSNIQTDQVFIVTAQKLARAALELREEDPDGSKGIAWVNDTLEDEAGVLDD